MLRERTTEVRARAVVGRSAYGLLGVAGVLVVLQAMSVLEIVDRNTFPPVTEDIAVLAEQMTTATFWSAVGSTMIGWAVGLGLAILIAVPVGVLVGSFPLAYRAFRIPIEFLRPIPSVALIPLAVLLFGTGMEFKLFLIVFASIWPILIQVLYGVQDVDPVASDTARSFGFGPVSRLVRVTLPSALPYAATGLRISASIALVLAITAEIVVGAPGLGGLINSAQQGGSYTVMYALILATGLLGWGVNVALERGERRVLHWHVSHRPTGAEL
ncbi:ABC transporter permease [Pseudonocardia sp.]|uniref:ABC transporter permease n=1 Tax=Pseudonocardia sp. TaxID=60912 RepID=UPI002623AAF2|nr:ABC transporter permease [Pseudonocardia sp.]